MTAYAFRPMSAADLPTIRRWLGTPHVSQWWHDPAEQFELVSGDLDHPDMAQYIVAADAREFAYLQCYNLSAWNTGFGAQPEARNSPTSCSRPVRPVSLSILTPPTRGRSAPARRRDFVATASSIRRMVRLF